jgi:hypothetical protein
MKQIKGLSNGNMTFDELKVTQHNKSVYLGLDQNRRTIDQAENEQRQR